MNELQSSIEKLNETISNKEKQGCETADVKRTLEENKNELQEWKQKKEIDVSDVLDLMKKDDECVNISSDLEELAAFAGLTGDPITPKGGDDEAK